MNNKFAIILGILLVINIVPTVLAEDLNVSVTIPEIPVAPTISPIGQFISTTVGGTLIAVGFGIAVLFIFLKLIESERISWYDLAIMLIGLMIVMGILGSLL